MLPKSSSQLKELIFNDSFKGNLKVTFSAENSVKGTAKNGTYIPTVTIRIGDKDKTRLKISWSAVFNFTQERGIHEAHLFYALKSVVTDIEKFLVKNKDQFGEINMPDLSRMPNIQNDLHSILKLLYSN